MQEPWTMQYQGALRPLWIPCYYQKVEELTHLAAYPSCDGFSPAVATSHVIHELPWALLDTNYYGTEVDIEKDAMRRARIYGSGFTFQSTPVQLCVFGHITLSLQAAISSFVKQG